MTHLFPVHFKAEEGQDNLNQWEDGNKPGHSQHELGYDVCDDGEIELGEPRREEGGASTQTTA